MTLGIWLLITLAILGTLGLLYGVWLIWEELAMEEESHDVNHAAQED